MHRFKYRNYSTLCCRVSSGCRSRFLLYRLYVLIQAYIPLPLKLFIYEFVSRHDVSCFFFSTSPVTFVPQRGKLKFMCDNKLFGGFFHPFIFVKAPTLPHNYNLVTSTKHKSLVLGISIVLECRHL